MIRDPYVNSKGDFIEKRDFDVFIACRLSDFSEAQKEMYFGKSIGELVLTPFTKGLDFDVKNKDHLLDLRTVLYAQLENQKDVSMWLANQGLNAVYHMNLSNSKNSYALSAWSFYQQIFDSNFFNDKLISQIADYEKLKVDSDKIRYHLIEESDSLDDAIKRIQRSNLDSSAINSNLQKQLKETEVAQLLFSHVASNSKSTKNNFQVTIKEKTPIRAWKKQRFEFAKKGFSKDKIPPFQLGAINMRDYVGFQIITGEVIDPNAKSYANSNLHKLERYYVSNSPAIFVDFDMKTDNYYLLNTRKMNGIQMYLAPNDLSIGKGLELTFEDVGGHPENFKDIFQTSFHLHGANAFSGNQLGTYDVRPHEQFSMTEENNRDNFISEQKKPVRTFAKTSEQVMKTLFNFVPLIDSYVD